MERFASAAYLGFRGFLQGTFCFAGEFIRAREDNHFILSSGGLETENQRKIRNDNEYRFRVFLYHESGENGKKQDCK